MAIFFYFFIFLRFDSNMSRNLRYPGGGPPSRAHVRPGPAAHTAVTGFGRHVPVPADDQPAIPTEVIDLTEDSPNSPQPQASFRAPRTAPSQLAYRQHPATSHAAMASGLRGHPATSHATLAPGVTAACASQAPQPTCSSHVQLAAGDTEDDMPLSEVRRRMRPQHSILRQFYAIGDDLDADPGDDVNEDWEEDVESIPTPNYSPLSEGVESNREEWESERAEEPVPGPQDQSAEPHFPDHLLSEPDVQRLILMQCRLLRPHGKQSTRHRRRVRRHVPHPPH